MTAVELRDLRKQLGWTQERLAQELGLSRDRIVKFENGQVAIRRQVALACEALLAREGKLA